MKKKFNVDFSNVATLGRQYMWIDKHIAPFFNIDEITQPDGYSEKFWSVLAGKEAHVDSFDYSDYEHATVLHDMNKPIPDEHKNKYSAVFDGGTLEHVFNYPVGLWNAMNMTQRGGYLFINASANNWNDSFCDGFYKFSPDLFFSVLNEANGFKIVDMTAINVIGYSNIDGSGKFFKLDNEHRSFDSRYHVTLHICAQRIGEIPDFDKLTIQQDYYVNAWSDDLASNRADSFLSKIKSFIVSVPFLYKPAIWLYHKLGYGRLAKEYDINKELKLRS